MALNVTITEDDFLTALRLFLLRIVPADVEVVQTQNNRVPAPKGEDYIVMTPTSRVRLASNVNTWDMDDPEADTMHVQHATQLTVQLDIHGPRGSDFAQIISTLTRDYYGCANMDDGIIQPLYATDGTQSPFINGENQYENRWVMSLVMQASPSVSTPQDFAVIVTTTIAPLGG